MKNLLKNLLPYKGIVFVVLLLMVAQAFFQMKLPQYTQVMIDVGIQNKGVEHILPEAVTVTESTSLEKHMTKNQRLKWHNLYESYDKDSEILKRKPISDKRLSALDKEYIEPILERYQQKLGKEKMDDAGDKTKMAMGIAYAVTCNEEAGLDTIAIQNRYMLKMGKMMLLVTLAILFVVGGVSFLSSRVGASIARNLRSKLFSNVMSFSNAEMSMFQTSSLITRATNDIQQVQMTTMMLLRMALFAPSICIWSIIRVYQMKAHMNFVIITGVTAIFLMMGVLFSVAMPKFKIMQKLVDALNAVSREIITGIQVIRAFGREEMAESRFDKANKDLYKNQLFVNRAMISMTPLLMIIMYGLSIWITWVAAGRIDMGEMQVGTMTAFIAYAMEIVFSFMMIASLAIFIPRAGIAADRIAEVIETNTTITDKGEIEDLPADAKGLLKFDNVSFRYPGAEEYVLADISFEVKPGETTAIIGSTGCGKTTLVNLIPRLFDVTGGSITLDGIDVRDMSLESLREAIGYVPQRGVMFSGTIDSNIRWGKEEASAQEVKEAAIIAQAESFISQKDEGFQSEISQGGANISGGQKQRLSIARAIIKRPKILIFDDSFSALDMRTDTKLRKALAEKMSKSSKIVVAQRIGTIMQAEQIIVLEDGRIAGKGNHRELMRSCDIYKDIAKSQLSIDEIEGISN